MLKGIDVSTWQGKIDWDKVKSDGVQFAILRAGYGANVIDKQFVRNIKECNRLEIPCGVYWFSYAYTEEMAAKEAMFCLEAIKPYRVEYPVVFDLEYDTIEFAKKKGVTINKQFASKLVVAFCDVVEKAGYYAMNYANLDYLRNMFDESLLKKYDLWYARYTQNLDRKVNLWQHTSSGKVSGIVGDVDMNISYLDYAKIIKSAGLNNLSEQKPTQPTEEVKQMEIFLGLKGKTVEEAQRVLNLDGHGLVVDGDFGKLTRSATIAFQQKHKLKVDGRIGPQTWSKLREIEKRPYRITKFDKMTTVVSFAKQNIKEIDILNSKTNFETVRAMYNRLMPKPTLVFNGGLFDTKTGASGSKFVDEGKKITNGYYSQYGLNIEADGAIKMGYESKSTKDFLGASPTLVINGFIDIDKKGLDINFLNGQHPRTAFAESEKEYHIIVVHGRRFWLHHYGMSCQQLATFCLTKLGAKNAINLDGGGSCMLLDETGSPINMPLENRGIDNAVCVYLGGKEWQK